MPTEKVSFTLDRDLLKEARQQVGRRGLSRVVNEALSDWLHARRIDRMLDEMDAEAGPIPEAMLEEVRGEWRDG